MTDHMTKSERADFMSLIRKREKLLKSQASERSAALLAEFDVQSAKIHDYDDDAVWAKATQEAEAAVDAARKQIEARCKELGIPEEFAPGLVFGWSGRGHNAVAERRRELRQAAKSKIEALEKEAITRIERMSLESQTSILAQGLETESAKQFLNAMPTMDALMPPVDIGEIQTLIEARKAQRKLAWSEYN